MTNEEREELADLWYARWMSSHDPYVAGYYNGLIRSGRENGWEPKLRPLFEMGYDDAIGDWSD